MARSLKILNEDVWFLGKDTKQEYPIYYRYVICYSLLSWLHKNGFDRDRGLEILNNLKNAIETENYFKEDNFMEIFPLGENWGFVIVDQADGIYPLTIYSKKREKDLGEVPQSQCFS